MIRMMSDVNLNALTLCMLGNFSCFCGSLLTSSNINFFHKIVNQFGQNKFMLPVFVFPIAPKSKHPPVVINSNLIGCCFAWEITYEMIDSSFLLRDYYAYQLHVNSSTLHIC